MPTLFDPYTLAGLPLRNRVVLAPMTRARSPEHVPTALNATYYRQRAGAGLIVSEGVPVSRAAHGVLYVPGLYTDAQTAGWKQVTQAVHDEGGAIFAQLWHVGRASHHSLQEGGQPPVSSTNRVAQGGMTFAINDAGQPGYVPASAPRALTTSEVQATVHDFAHAAARAIQAGFDGVEIHGANGYLLEQFLNPTVNDRTDQYGAQTLDNRVRFVLEVVDAVIGQVGTRRTGIRFSPWGKYNDMAHYPEIADTYAHLAREMAQRGIAYIHFMDQANGQGKADVQGQNEAFLRQMRSLFPNGAIIHAGNMTLEAGNRLLAEGIIDLVGIGQPYIANPDLVERLRHGHPLAQPDRATYYGGGAAGYTDYPVYGADAN